MDKDLYRLLGVGESASADEIKKAYRRLARRYHPDRANGGGAGDDERFKEISQAYDILGDDKKRQQYDEMRRYGAFSGGGRRGFNPSDFQGFGGMGGGGGGLGGIFESLFGGGGMGQSMRAPQPGRDVRAEMSVSFETAVKGGKQPLTLVVNEPNASGQLRAERKTVSVSVPTGIGDGQKIRLAGQGGPGVNGGPPGSLLITVNVQPHATFTRKGANIYSTVQVDLATAVLGGKVRVKTMDKTVTLNVAPGAQPGQKFKLTGLGGPRRGSGRGDHYVTIEVALPKALSEDQKKSFGAFAATLNGDVK